MWVKFNDQAPNDPEIDALSDGAFRLWFTAICYCQAEFTNGFITEAKLRRLTPNFKASHLKELTRPSINPSGPIFQQVGDGYSIRNFTKWNKTADYWRDQQVKAAKRKADYMARKEAEG